MGRYPDLTPTLITYRAGNRARDAEIDQMKRWGSGRGQVNPLLIYKLPRQPVNPDIKALANHRPTPTRAKCER